jgi:nucleotide-binding universal stress UspA family protein
MYFEDLDTSATVTSESQLEQVVEDLRASGLKADRAERWGAVAAELQNLARETSADLLVLGTHAPRGVDRLFFGSVAEEVAERSGWPVMLIGPKAEAPSGAWSPHEVVCVTQQRKRDVSAAVYGYHLSRLVGAAFTLVTITDKSAELPEGAEQKPFLKLLAEELPGVDVAYEIPRREIRRSVAKDSIMKLLATLEPGAVVMPSEKAGLLHSHFHTDLLSVVVAEARCPVIAVAGVEDAIA